MVFVYDKKIKEKRGVIYSPMKKVFDMHCHYFLFDLTIKERAEIFKEEFEITQTGKACFLSIPQEFSNKGEIWFDALHNVKGMFLKKNWSLMVFMCDSKVSIRPLVNAVER